MIIYFYLWFGAATGIAATVITGEPLAVMALITASTITCMWLDRGRTP